jgi:hypothetical protein
MRKDAPFSIGNEGAGTSAALMAAEAGLLPVAASAAADAPRRSALRRVISLVIVLSRFFLFPALNRR